MTVVYKFRLPYQHHAIMPAAGLRAPRPRASQPNASNLNFGRRTKPFSLFRSVPSQTPTEARNATPTSQSAHATLPFVRGRVARGRYRGRHAGPSAMMIVTASPHAGRRATALAAHRWRRPVVQRSGAEVSTVTRFSVSSLDDEMSEPNSSGRPPSRFHRSLGEHTRKA